jgi:menaquinone-specific isochorismate synthase
MTDIAFFRLPTGQAWLGLGPFGEYASQPKEDAFYWNDFDLSDPRPWKVPSHWVAVNSATDLEAVVGTAMNVKVQWEKPLTEGFKMAFRRIRREVQTRRLAKMVPVLTERGHLIKGSAKTLLHAALTSPNNLWGYGRVSGENGFVGATPELLFEATGTEVKTMALAGTAKPGASEAFLLDLKEIDEHECVASFLAERLATLGDMQRSPRGLCDTVGLRHFQTTLQVHCDQPTTADELIRLLHPTPAVGCLPRTDAWLTKLREYRSLLRVPGFFGAPFGLSIAGTQHFVVAIRGLCWQGNELTLPSGCGIVGGSAFDHEWRELRLKREAVGRLLGV